MSALETAPLIDAIPMPLVVISPDGRIAAANEPAEGLLGQGLVGRHHAAALRHPVILDTVEAAQARGSRASDRYLTTDGQRDVTYLVHAAPMPWEGGGQAIVVAFDDITQMQAAGQMRRDFVANVSHELRTPLTAMLGFIETLLGPARDDPQASQTFLKMMQDETLRMNRLVQDLLSLSRVESEERLRPKSKADVAAAVRRAVSSLAPAAEDFGVSLHVDGCDEPVEVAGSEDQLQQVFSNLIENAIKYGAQPGEVRVVLRQSAREPSLRGPAVRVDVIDEGAGIDEVHLPRLTERFYRIDDHRSRELGGTGLGLAIVKHIINRHRGRLRVESVVGKGSRFAVILPSA